MRAAVGHGNKRFSQRTDGHLPGRLVPPLRHHLPLFIEHEKGQIRTGKLFIQRGRSCLGVQIEGGYARGCGAVPEAEQDDGRPRELAYGCCVQRYVTVCWILSRVWRVTISSESILAKVRLKLPMFPEKNCGSRSECSPA